MPLSAARRALATRARQCVRTFWALKGIEFEVARGETVGIIGRNGSGKSTLLQIICGTLAPTSGQIETHGRIAALLELGSGFDVEYTGRENIFINGQLHGLSHEQIESRLADIIAFADIGEFIDQPVKTYSSGMFVRLAFSVIAHVDADILVIDEALSVGDAFFTQKCMRFLRRFQQTGTVLFVSHDSSAVRGLCDRVIWLDRGVVRESGDAKRVCTNYFEAFYRQARRERQGQSVEDKSEVMDRKANRLAKLRKESETFDQRERFRGTGTLVAPHLDDVAIDTQHLPVERQQRVIRSVVLAGEDGNALSWIAGGERVSLEINFDNFVGKEMPVVGFVFKDRLGQPLFGDSNFFASDSLKLPIGDKGIARFMFEMPTLLPGEYAISVYAARRIASEAELIDCIHDVLIVKSESTAVATGIVGIRMSQINLFVESELEKT
ncbi:ABC transporter ATP-binding protein [Caballeronia sp. TF1N1]|uniref:ABC transporter ATP-binding protein n=1 Tax=Caballeronia sp. TF1N1 TaxID=2878153 RepID=UPI00351D13C1